MVRIGKIVNTHGNKGEVKVYPLTDFPERFQDLKKVFLMASPKPVSLLIEKVRFHKGRIIMKLKGYDTISEAESLKELEIGIPEKQLRPLGVDEYYYFQIIGLNVYTDEGVHLGIVTEIFPTGSNDVYTVKKEQKEYLIPAIKEVIKEVNLETKKIIIHPLKGLLDPSNAL